MPEITSNCNLPLRHDDRPTSVLDRCRRRPLAHALSNPKGWRDAPVNRHGVVAIPFFWVALFLSLHFHAAMLWFWVPRLPNPHLSIDEVDPGQARTVLVTRLAPITPPTPASPPPPSPPPAAATPTARAPAPTATIRPPRMPPVVVPNAPPPEPPSPPIPAPVTAPTPRPAPETDLASYVEAKRRARGDPVPIAGQGAAANAPSPETEIERRDRIVAANLAPSQQPTFGYDPKSGGGVFQLKRLGYEDAEFYFTGWNKDIGRRAKQLIEVRRGTSNDIRRVIVEKMIAIIREQVQGDFSWMSDRVGHPIMMSARLADNAVLEEFLMEEFFTDPRRPR